MSDETTQDFEQPALTDTPDTGAGAGYTPPPPEPEEPQSLRETIESSMKEIGRDKEEKPEPEPEKAEEVKDEKPKAEKAEKAEAKEAEPEAKVEEKPKREKVKEDGPRYLPPKNFAPDSQNAWQNVPRSVKRDIDVMQRTYAEEVQRYQEAAQRYESFKPYDDLAKQHGRDLTTIIDKVVNIERTIAQNPLAGVQMFIAEMLPRRADGSPISLYEFAQHVVQQNPQQLHQGIQQSMPQPKHPAEVEAEQLRQALEQQQRQLLAMQVIEPFKQQHPRYDELEADIAFFLKSDRVPQNLTPEERLEMAYAMAERMNPPSNGEYGDDSRTSRQAPANNRVDRDDFSGRKSIKSTPGAVRSVDDSAESGSIRETLERELKKMKARS